MLFCPLYYLWVAANVATIEKTDFVDSVGEVVDLVGGEVVGDNGECTGSDTERGVHEGLGDTGGELCGVRRAGGCEGLE